MIGWALSGGNTKGGLQVGMAKRLQELGQMPGVIVGTSVGAIHAFLIRQVGIEGAEALWLSLKSSSELFRFNWGALLFRSAGLYSLAPLREQLVEIAKAPPKHPEIRACAVVCDMRSEQVFYVSDSSDGFVDAVVASCSEPGFIEPVNGAQVDGGIREFAPVEFLIDQGCTDIHVLLTTPVLKSEEWGPGNWLTNASRGLSIALDEIYRGDIAQAKLKNRIRHLENLLEQAAGRPAKNTVANIHQWMAQWAPNARFDVDPDMIREAIRLGYEAVQWPSQ